MCRCVAFAAMIVTEIVFCVCAGIELVAARVLVLSHGVESSVRGKTILISSMVPVNFNFHEFMCQESNPLSLLHGGDPAAHIAAIEKQLLQEVIDAEKKSSRLQHIPEFDEFGNFGA